MTMTLISTVTLTSDTSSISFASIPQTGTDLMVVFSGRSTNATRSVALWLSHASPYSEAQVTGRLLSGDGSTATSRSAATDIGQVPPNTATANTFSNITYYIPNYTSSTTKSVSVDSVYENNGTSAYQFIIAGSGALNTNVDTLALTAGTSFAIGSTVSLYTITKGSGGASVS